MKTFLSFFFLLQISINLFAQGGWSWEELPQMPEKTSNNAVCYAEVNDTSYMYSFFGIDSTKIWSGIHSKAYKYNIISQVWDTLPDIPDSLGGVIAAGATTINNKIYIIGGYHVYSNHDEVSSYETIIFDPVTETYSRGKNIPIEIDDHIQIGYKDSLIYVISGWTSSIGGGNNTNKVQVYDAINDEWYLGNDMPNTSTYKVFGASGTIVNDTIYFTGGAKYDNNFPLLSILRKGLINQTNPLDITWSVDTVVNNFKPYRSVAFNYENKVFWIGGSSVPYNYDGIAYNGSGGVAPNNFITEYNSETNKWAQYSTTDFQIMDLRGLAKTKNDEFIICGGMNENQEVVNNTYLLKYDSDFQSLTDSIDVQILNGEDIKNNDLEISKSNNTFTVLNYGARSIRVYDLFGRAIKNVDSNTVELLGVRGLLIIQVTFRDGSLLRKKVFLE